MFQIESLSLRRNQLTIIYFLNNIFMKKISLLLAGFVLFFAPQAQAQDDNIFKHVGFGVGFGLSGITIDASTMITDYVGVRAGVDIFPGISYGTDVDMSGLSEATQKAKDLNTVPGMTAYQTPDVPEKLKIEGKLALTTGHVLFDAYPFKKSSFHFTAGAYFGSSDIVKVYNQDDGAFKDVRQFNDRTGKYSNWSTVDGAPRIGMQMGDYFLQPDLDGNLEASIRVNGFQPYLGIGFGRAVPLKSRLSCQFDLGVKFWGTPSIYLQDHELSKEDLGGKGSEIFDYMSKITIYPVMTVRLVGRIL